MVGFFEGIVVCGTGVGLGVAVYIRSSRSIIMLDDDTSFICQAKETYVVSVDLTFVGRILRRIYRWIRGWVRRGCIYIYIIKQKYYNVR